MPKDSAASSSLARPLRPVLTLAILVALAAPLTAQLGPPTNGGFERLDRILQQLAESRRVLVVGAHPDDEDTGLLALAVRKWGARAAYLSLTRGEGGQNLIGQELGVELGLLRTSELVSARSVDGAEQFFTRAFDFGYTRSLEETLTFWPRDSLLKDVVRVVRRFRPHVIVSVFSGSSGDGHGQHQAAGVIAHRAFAVAGDPDVFAELELEEGLRAWTPLKLYRSTWFQRSATTMRATTAVLDRREGKTIHQIAAASRSRHASQDMGRVQDLGSGESRLALVSSRVGSDPANASDWIFANVPAGTGRLADVADSIRSSLTITRLSSAAMPLTQSLEMSNTPREDSLLQEAIAVASGVVLDARVADSTVVPGQSVRVTVEVFNGGSSELRVQDVSLRTPDRWLVTGTGAALIPPGESREFTLTVTPDSNAALTQPYFLRGERNGYLYDWSGVAPEVRGLPFGPAPLRATIRLERWGRTFELLPTVTHRSNDQARGEVRVPFRVVPAVDVRVDPELVVWPRSDDSTRHISVVLTGNVNGGISGTLGLDLGGSVDMPSIPFTLEEGASRTFDLALTRPDNGRDRVDVEAVALVDGRRYDRGVSVVSYPHIEPVASIRRGRATLRLVDLNVPPLSAVGYVRGAADRVPEYLERVGVPITLLDPEMLESGDLHSFDAIIVGSRAYETDAALRRHNRRLLDYVEQGGLMLVQYQQYQFVRGGYAPFELEIAQPHDRVTDENAPVTALAPDHAALQYPHRIGPEDWDGWPQERGLYFAHRWSPAYSPLLRIPGQNGEPLEGSLLLAEFGRGTYIYTGLSFFRAIPAGVPGAYRLLINLLSLELSAVP